MQSRTYDLFISYSRRDNQSGRITEFVDRISRDFESFAGRPLRPFFDIKEIHGMDDWRHRILQGLRESRLLVACISPSLLASEYCAWEFNEYVNNEVARALVGEGVAPIYFVEAPNWGDNGFEENCAEWVAELRRRQYYDLRPWFNEGEQALREAVVKQRLEDLNRQIAERIQRGERAEQKIGNVVAHNPHFIGRKTEIRNLREKVALKKIGALTVVHGVGGMGKTALAVEYAHAFAHEYGGGCWQIFCEGRDDLIATVAMLAPTLGVEFTDEEKIDTGLQFDRILLELRRLSNAREPYRCLLILDNVNQPKLLEPAKTERLPAADWLHIIATSRLGEDDLYGRHKDRSFLPVDELPEPDALALIESYQPGGKFADSNEREAAGEIARQLDRFTLAVETVAVYLGQYSKDVSCADFLERLKKEGVEGLDSAAGETSEGIRHGEKRLGATLRPTLEKLSDAEKLALNYASLLPADQIALPWVRTLTAAKYKDLGQDAEPGYPDPWRRALRRLISLRLLQPTGVVDGNGQPLVARMHRLLQDLLQNESSEVELAERQQNLEKLVGERDSVLESTTRWSEARWEVDPLDALARMWAENDHPQAAWLLNQVGKRGYALAEYTQAEPLMRRALEIDEASYGKDHPYVAIRLNNLAQLLQVTNRLAEAEPLMRRALEIDEASYGKDHPKVARDLNNLAQLLKATNRLAEAEPLMRRALEVLERSLGPEHPSTVIALTNYAYLLREMSREDEADKLEVRGRV